MSDDADDLVVVAAKAERLLRQCKKHQIFHEKREEAVKQGEAGALYLRLANSLPKDDEDERVAHMETAAQCFSRAKRLCRDILRGKTGS